MSEAQEVIQRFAQKEYGQFIFVDPPVFDKENRVYSSNIRSKIPVFIHDDRNPERYQVRVLKIDSLGKIYLNSDYQLVSEVSTLQDKCYDNLEKMLELWRRRTENIIVSTTSSSLVAIDEFRIAFSKFELILDHLETFGEIKKVELRRYMPTQDKVKLPRYLALLEELDLIRKIDTGYKPGNLLVTIESKVPDYEERRQHVLSYILRNRYLTLRDVFQLTLLESAIKIENMIYLPELEIGDSIYQKYSSIERAFKHHYKEHINRLHLTRNLRRLESCGAIKRDGERYFGVDDYREEMITMKKKLKPLSIYPQ